MASISRRGLLLAPLAAVLGAGKGRAADESAFTVRPSERFTVNIPVPCRNEWRPEGEIRWVDSNLAHDRMPS